MSSIARATTHPTATSPASAPAGRPRLEVVHAPAPQRSLAPFLFVCVAVLLGALVAALMLNTAMAVASYRIHDTQVELNQLTELGDELAEQAEVLNSPASLESKATTLGMVPPEETLYVSVSSGTILGASEEGK